MKAHNQVRVIAFLTTKDEQPIGPIPDNYLAKDKNIPKDLKSEMIKNGWEDRSGFFYWSHDFKPAPVRGKDGYVYICISDADMEDNSRFLSRMQEAAELLSL